MRIIIWAGLVVNCTKKGIQTVKRALLLVLQSLYKSVKVEAKMRNDVQRKPDQRANVIRRFVGGRGKDPLGDQRLWFESTGRRIETNRQGSIDVWAASSVFPCQISRVPPCLYPFLMEGWDIHGGVIERGRPFVATYHNQMRAEWTKRRKDFFPL